MDNGGYFNWGNKKPISSVSLPISGANDNENVSKYNNIMISKLRLARNPLARKYIPEKRAGNNINMIGSCCCNPGAWIDENMTVISSATIVVNNTSYFFIKKA